MKKRFFKEIDVKFLSLSNCTVMISAATKDYDGIFGDFEGTEWAEFW